MVDRGTFTDFANDLSFVAEVVRSHATPLDAMTPLPEGWIPADSSVICARGQDAYNHIGNRRFRVLIEAHVQIYEAASSKVEKSVVVMKIVDTVRECSGVLGGFVRKDTLTGRWFEVGDATAREKAGQQFRTIIASTDPTKYQRKRRKRVNKKKKSAGKLQEEGSNDHMTSNTLKNRSSRSVTASSRGTTTSHQESTRTSIVKNAKAEYEQSSSTISDWTSLDGSSNSSNSGAKIFGDATSSNKYSWGEDRFVRNQSLLGVPFPRCSSAPPSSGGVGPDRQSSWERLDAVAKGKIEGVFGRFEQPTDATFPSSSYIFTSTEDDNGSLNEKEMLQEGGKSSQEERMNTSCPSLCTSSDRRQLMDLQRMNTSCPSFGIDPKDCTLAGSSTRSSINKQPCPVEHQYNCLLREAPKSGVSDTTSTKHGRCDEVLWNRVFRDPPNFDIDDTFAFL